MRLILLRALLLVVFLNTVVGMPLHATEHLPGPATGGAAGFQDLSSHQHEHVHEHEREHAHAEPSDCEGGDHTTVHAQCVWCPSHAQLALALATVVITTLPALVAAPVFNPAAPDAFVPLPERWRYASRDPPSLS